MAFNSRNSDFGWKKHIFGHGDNKTQSKLSGGTVNSVLWEFPSRVGSVGQIALAPHHPLAIKS